MTEIFVISVGYDYEYENPVGVSDDLDTAKSYAQKAANKEKTGNPDNHVDVYWWDTPLVCPEWNEWCWRGVFPHNNSSSYVLITKVPVIERV